MSAEVLNLDIAETAEAMVDAARSAVPDRWPELQVLAERELRRLAQSLAETASDFLDGKLTEAHARQLAHMHQMNARQVLLLIDGVALLTAEQTIHAGVRAAAEAINALVKFKLL